MEYGIKKYVDSGPSGDNWINGNKFTNLWGINTKYFLYESKNASSGGSQAIGGNTYDFDYQKEANSSTPCFEFLGTGNYIFARVWDWDAAHIMRFAAGKNKVVTTLEASDIDTVTGINDIMFFAGTGHGAVRVSVGPDAGMFPTLADAFANITPSYAHPYTIDVLESTVETRPVTFESECIVNLNGKTIYYPRTGSAVPGFVANSLVNFTIRDGYLRYKPSSDSSYALYVKYCTSSVIFDTVNVLNMASGAGMRALTLEGSNVLFNNCRFFGSGSGTGHGVRIVGETSPSDTSVFRDCYGEGRGTGSYGFYGSSPAANWFFDCVGFSDVTGNAFAGKTSASTYSGCLNKTGTSTYTAYP